MNKALFVCAVVTVAVNCKIFLHESFDNDDAWTPTGKTGKMKLATGEIIGDKAINQGYQTSQDAHFYATSRPLTAPLENDGGNKDYVVSMSLKNEQDLDCGGGYIKLLFDNKPEDFDGKTDYALMFGPDKCGSTNKIHIIFNYKGENLLWKKEPSFPLDKLTHVYTLHVKSDDTYVLYVDKEQKESGSLEEDWSFLPPKEIDDPEDKKPEDWVEDAMMADPEDKKPEDWDKEAAEIPDENAKQPEDWDSEEDGEWERPMVPNPNFKGEWSPKQIKNPGYKGEWSPKQIANPKYINDGHLNAIAKPVQQVGIDIWQVASGSIFDNIIIGDNLEEVNALVDQTWGAVKEGEAKKLKEIEAEKEAEQKKKADEEQESAEPEDSEDDEASDNDDDTPTPETETPNEDL